MNKSWLCANIGVAFIVCTLILYLLFLLIYIILGMGLYSMLLLNESKLFIMKFMNETLSIFQGNACNIQTTDCIVCS